MFIKTLGHFSQTTKMPCPSYSMSAFDCITTDPICLTICYAKKHHYNFRNVKEALAKNKNKYMLKNWSKNFSSYLQLEELDIFRWFDSGDLPSILMLEKICEIADLYPTCKFWLPTRRDDLLIAKFEAQNCVKFNELYPNLIIRLSGKEIDKEPNLKLAEYLGINVSSVTSDLNVYTCNAKDQGGKCLACRKCWNKDIKEVIYFVH